MIQKSLADNGQAFFVFRGARVIDLIARDPNGTIHVIDYKTGSVIGDERWLRFFELKITRR